MNINQRMVRRAQYLSAIAAGMIKPSVKVDPIDGWLKSCESRLMMLYEDQQFTDSYMRSIYNGWSHPVMHVDVLNLESFSNGLSNGTFFTEGTELTTDWLQAQPDEFLAIPVLTTPSAWDDFETMQHATIGHISVFHYNHESINAGLVDTVMDAAVNEQYGLDRAIDDHNVIDYEMALAMEFLQNLETRHAA